VRTCDGYRFPVSFATLPSRFPEDEQKCAALCPSAETELFYHPYPGGTEDDLVSLNGINYTALPNAGRYRDEVVEGCSCDAVTLQLEAARQERRVASLGADDSAPAEAGDDGAGADGDSENIGDDGKEAKLTINFDSLNPLIVEVPGDDASGDETASDKTQTADGAGGGKRVELSTEKPPRDKAADYHPNRVFDRRPPSEAKIFR